jgi:hypothetical protein
MAHRGVGLDHAPRVVRALIEQAVADSEDRSIGRGRQLSVVELLARVGGGGEALPTRLDPPDRTAEVSNHGGDQDLSG